MSQLQLLVLLLKLCENCRWNGLILKLPSVRMFTPRFQIKCYHFFWKFPYQCLTMPRSNKGDGFLVGRSTHADLMIFVGFCFPFFCVKRRREETLREETRLDQLLPKMNSSWNPFKTWALNMTRETKQSTSRKEQQMGLKLALFESILPRKERRMHGSIIRRQVRRYIIIISLCNYYWIRVVVMSKSELHNLWVFDHIVMILAI